MIKTVKLVKQIKDRYKLPVDLFELSQPMTSFDESSLYLIGGFHSIGRYPIISLYLSDENGDALNFEPIIQEEGITNYKDLFVKFNYTLID